MDYELARYEQELDCIADEIILEVNENMGECVRLLNKGFTGENGYRVTLMCEGIGNSLISLANKLKY